MSSLRTAADVRSYFLKNWRELLPDLLVTQARVAPAPQDDTMVHVELRDEVGHIRHLLFVPLASGEPRLLRGLLPRIRELSRTNVWAGLLVPHMGAAGLRVCREAGIGYVDCCANAYLHFNQVVVQIAGNRNRFNVPKRPRTLFNDKATIPLRILLENPEASVTTRQIADRGGMSLGWVSQILQQLHSEGYVERKRGGGTRLLHPGRLLDDWLRQYSFEQNNVYPFQMREPAVAPTLERLRALQPPLFDRYALTLDAAVSALSATTETEQLHVYLPDLAHQDEDALDAWATALSLRPAGHSANCFLIGPTYTHAAFFGMRRAHGLRLVSDLQLYLDLFHYPAASRPRARAAVAARLPFSVGESG